MGLYWLSEDENSGETNAIWVFGKYAIETEDIYETFDNFQRCKDYILKEKTFKKFVESNDITNVTDEVLFDMFLNWNKNNEHKIYFRIFREVV